MKKELEITKGNWILTDMLAPISKEIPIGSFSIGVDVDNRCWVAEAKGCHVNDGMLYGELQANAQLIAEAGTVANETGKTPRQLADENKALLEVLIKVKNSVDLSLLPPSVELSINSAIKQATDGNR